MGFSSRWNGIFSEIKNGVRKGAILSGILYCFYCTELFERLKRRRSGCSINDNYLGIIGYSDDKYLLTPSLEALQDMLKTCEEFAEEHGLQFSVDPNIKKCETKFLGFLTKERDLRPLNLCGNMLPWPAGLILENTSETTLKIKSMA